MADALLAALAAMSPWEGAAVLFAIAYLVLATREHIACWPCAFVSTMIYTVLFFNVSLLMESALNVYYLAMAVYGWVTWRGTSGDTREAVIHTWRPARHVAVITFIVSAAALSGQFLATHTSAAWPFVDSLTTWGAVVTTFMVARKVLENWIYWFVIDAVCIPLYIERGLVLTAALFALYLVIVVFGYLGWRRQYHLARTESGG